MRYGIYKELNKENIYSKISSYSIFKKYCPGFEEIGKAFKSPMRDNDIHPSTFITPYKGDLLYKDFGGKSCRAIQFVVEYFGLTYKEALEKINYDFNLQLGRIDYVFHNDNPIIEHMDSSKIKDKNPVTITIKSRSFNDGDHNYWEGRYKIKESTLRKFNVIPISNFCINGFLYFSDKLSYSYDYYWENDIFRRKIYQPLSSYNKWFSNGGLIVQGEGVLPKHGDLLIITSSLKDVMTLYELGYTAIAPTSESTFVPKEYFSKQHDRFKKIILFMDSDKSGMEANKRLSKKLGLDYIYIPEQYGSKDISDLVFNCDQYTANKLLISLIYGKYMVST